jgi:hypothetical protein
MVYEEKLYKSHTCNVKQGIEYAQRRGALGMILYPLSAARWSHFKNHNKVPSAATFFGVLMFNLSGTIILLLLIVTPQL